jgi:hypothetical protein
VSANSGIYWQQLARIADWFLRHLELAVGGYVVVPEMREFLLNLRTNSTGNLAELGGNNDSMEEEESGIEIGKVQGEVKE